METLAPAVIEWGVATRPLPGQKESGDRHWVRVRNQKALVAVVDGLGHGEAAAATAKIAVAALANHGEEPSVGLVRRCCERLRYTRGVVMSLASFYAPDNTMTWIGVGNVEGVLLHWDAQGNPSQKVLLVCPGVVGDRDLRLVAYMIQVTPGDLLLFATDGIGVGFEKNINSREPPQQIADRILAEFAQATDDALVLVARYVYGQGGTKGG